MNNKQLGIEEFLKTGFDLKSHLAEFLQISVVQLESKLPNGIDALAALHPGSFTPEDASDFYEKKVGDAHLIDLASWHLNSANYIADTLRLQEMFAKGKVLDFGGGIGTHALAVASLENVEHVWFVDLNPQNRDFVKARAESLNLSGKLSVYRDLQSLGDIKFDTLVCLDVLEHLPDPSAQLITFLERLLPQSIILMNWYFFKGNNGEYPFHFDDPSMINQFFHTLQSNFIEVFHPYLITTRAYKPLKS
ncbi:class I SAM-dependent methyltransferase [Prochlorococcus sp. MIT 1223]|uniref:class I SAM-dependent methyltransferase n=1 Tax=Prochlorococcus sp. MIT 1223 TaxID=3096217 RepID=UPI002A76525B|nr:methyltransferase domain-containing protein [Prochlorococcus sp. MIT 1223]